MATIALYASKINQMPLLMGDFKKSVSNYNDELFSLKSKALNVNKSVCNLDDVISSIQTSTQTQEEKITSLETFSQNSENFIADVVYIDGAVADVVNKNKDDFYDQYCYLNPEPKKNGWEKFCDGMAAAGEWCKKHWKAIVTVVIVVVVIVLLCTGVGGILGAMALGALLGAAIGGTVGGVMSALSGGSFFEGFENGAFSGAIAGIISGSMGFALSAGGTVALSLGQTLLIGGVSGIGSSLVSDVGDILIKGEDISLGQIIFNMGISGALGVAFSGIGYGVSKFVGLVFKNTTLFSKAKELFRIGKTSSSSYGKITSYTTNKPKGVSLNFANKAGKSIIRFEFDENMFLHYHLPSLFGTKAHMPILPIFSSALSNSSNHYLSFK